MKSEPGTYALILEARFGASVQIGRWRRIDLAPGYYIYIGSAFGPGGVKARVLRHFRGNKARHWHVDYLREVATPIGAWYSHEPGRLEHRWARVLSEMNGMSPIEGFGCSDCGCCSHLFWTSAEPDFTRFSRIVGGRVESWTY